MLLTHTYPCIMALKIKPIKVKNSNWVLELLMSLKNVGFESGGNGLASAISMPVFSCCPYSSGLSCEIGIELLIVSMST